MTTYFDSTIVPENISESKEYERKYYELSIESQRAVEKVFNPEYENNIIETYDNYSIDNICILMITYKVEYKQLSHKLRINERIINTFIHVLNELQETESKLSYDDLLFKDKYIPIVLIYNKEFILRLLKINACGTFSNYKIHYPNSYLLNDFDINKYALHRWCCDPFCLQYNILSDINEIYYEELINEFLEYNSWAIKSHFDDFEIEYTEERLEICLTKEPSLHNYIGKNYRLPNKYKTIEYITYLIELGIKLNDIYIPLKIRTPELYIKAVNKNGLNLRDVPDKFITSELVKVAVSNTNLALLVAPIDFVKNEDFNGLLEHINYDLLKSLDLCIKKKHYPYFSIQNRFIINGYVIDCNDNGTNKKKQEIISNILKDNRDLLLKYVKLRPDYYCKEVFSILEYFIEDYEILYYIKMKEFVAIERFNKIAFMNYLISKENYTKVKQLLTFMNDYTIDIIYKLVKINVEFIIHFEDKYWDGVLINKYEQYKIKNTTNYMYFLSYLKSKSVETKFINENVLSFLTNNYNYFILLYKKLS